jgi:hypothetical protein
MQSESVFPEKKTQNRNAEENCTGTDNRPFVVS